MWNYVRLHRNDSPMAEILSMCSNKSNLRLVIYHLSENHVECATVPEADNVFKLSSEELHEIKADAHGLNHAILAYDVVTSEVFLIDVTPELPIASAVLLCVVTELLNGNVQPRKCAVGAPRIDEDPRVGDDCEQCVCRRDERGRFTSVKVNDEPWRTPPTMETADSVLTHRFRLGRR